MHLNVGLYLCTVVVWEFPTKTCCQRLELWAKVDDNFIVIIISLWRWVVGLSLHKVDMLFLGWVRWIFSLAFSILCNYFQKKCMNHCFCLNRRKFYLKKKSISFYENFFPFRTSIFSNSAVWQLVHRIYGRCISNNIFICRYFVQYLRLSCSPTGIYIYSISCTG